MATISRNHTRTEKLLLEAARTFNTAQNYDELMASVLRLVITALDCEAALVFRVDSRRPDVKIRAMKDSDQQMITFRHEIDHSIAGEVAKTQEPAIVNDLTNNKQFDPNLVAPLGLDVRSLISVPLIGKGHLIGVVEAVNKSDGEFSEADLDILTGLNNQMAVAIDNAHLMRELHREALERKLLYDVGMKLAGGLELDDVLIDILRSLKQVVTYDVGGVFLIKPDSGDIDSIYTEGYDRGVDEKLHLKMGQGLVGHVANTGEGIIVSDVANDNRYISAHDDTRSEIVVPIKVENKVIGVINLESNQPDAYDEHSMNLMTAFASHAAITLERARMHESLIQGRKLDEQLNVARTIQRTFLPEKPPRIEGYDVYGENVSSFQVGGDYYDFIRIVESQYGLAIADVSGKGVPAALIMASFRASLIAEIRNNYSIRSIAQKVNRLMAESLESGRYVTGVYGVLDSANNIFTYTNFGHNLPFLLKADGSVVDLKVGGPVMGVTAKAEFEEQALFLHPGDMIVLYTDGVTEVFDADGKEFGADGLVAVVKRHQHKSAREIKDAVYSAVRDFATTEHTWDDFTVMIVKRLEA